MPWKEICPMDERMSFLVQVNESDESFAALCRRYGISRKTGYKWVFRYEQEGASGLLDRRPLAASHPDRVPDGLVDIIVAAGASTSRATSLLATRLAVTRSR
jgi:putative transposase